MRTALTSSVRSICNYSPRAPSLLPRSVFSLRPQRNTHLRRSKYGGFVRAVHARATAVSRSENPTSSSLGEEVRLAMREIPHPLMVVTAETSRGKKTGLLVSSFNTVTLTPEPIVSFNIKLPSSTYEAISESNRFQVSAIWDQEHASKSANWQISWNQEASKDSDPLAPYRLFAFRCEWLREKSMEVGDHVIMVGRVLDHIPSYNRNQEAKALVYSEGRYRHASAPLEELRQADKNVEEESLSRKTQRHAVKVT